MESIPESCLDNVFAFAALFDRASAAPASAWIAASCVRADAAVTAIALATPPLRREANTLLPFGCRIDTASRNSQITAQGLLEQGHASLSGIEDRGWFLRRVEQWWSTGLVNASPPLPRFLSRFERCARRSRRRAVGCAEENRGHEFGVLVH